MEHTQVAAWQLDFFGEELPVLATRRKPDPLPDPHLWSESVREKMVDALISLARDSRRGDKMPESLKDCASMLSDRLCNRKVDVDDYRATLGWMMGYWDGALPFSYVCAVSGIDPESIQYEILENALLARDLAELRQMCFGTLL